MFELSVALRYLIPRWRQLSVSIISLVSVLVIALVVWLIIVFFSVTSGLEQVWTEKLIALTAPVRVTPTDEYTNSTYFRIDSISLDSNYTLKTLAEKRRATETNPHDPDLDSEVPLFWPPADLNEDGFMKDLVKLAFQAVSGVQGVDGVQAEDYEVSFANVRVRLVRPQEGTVADLTADNQTFLTQTSWLSSFDGRNPYLEKAIVEPSAADIENLLYQVGLSTDRVQEDSAHSLMEAGGAKVGQRLQSLLASIDIRSLKTPLRGWQIPLELFREDISLQVCAIADRDQVRSLIAPKKTSELRNLQEALEAAGYRVRQVEVSIQRGELKLTNVQDLKLTPFTTLSLAGNTRLAARVDQSTISAAARHQDVRYLIDDQVQEHPLYGMVRFGSLHLDEAKIDMSKPSQYWVTQSGGAYQLPDHPELGSGVVLAKQFRDSGVSLGDRGYLSYHTPTASSVQEQRIPFFVAGFYDPGVIPVGGKFVLVDKALTTLVRAGRSQQDDISTTGINVWFDDIAKSDQVKEQIQRQLSHLGIAQYWKVETYREYEFTRDLLTQLRSDRNLYILIAIIIIVVACSNIVTLLILLVNDKKLEIGILRSMGASAKSIAAIFGFCGVCMACAGSLLGTLIASITLRYLNALVSFISEIQGYEAFNSAFYGDALPNQLSFEAILFVLITTSVTSLIAGVVPAVKASLLKPASVLRSE